jgi:Cu/Zn superoxide dismutase
MFDNKEEKKRIKFYFQGFHVHVNAVSDASPNCTAAGGHFNPYSKSLNHKFRYEIIFFFRYSSWSTYS